MSESMRSLVSNMVHGVTNGFEKSFSGGRLQGSG